MRFDDKPGKDCILKLRVKSTMEHCFDVLTNSH